MIFDLKSNTVYTRITDAVDFGENPIISVIGAGGKTTLVKQLAKEYRRAAVTTTTHMYKEAPLAKSADEVNSSRDTVWFGSDLGEKIGISPFIDDIRGIPLIIEADGSRHMPFKISAPHEPAIYARSTAVTAVLGLNAIGKSLIDVTYRPEDMMSFLGAKPNHIITPRDFSRVILEHYGQLTSASYELYIFLSHADTKERIGYAEEIAALCEKYRIYSVDLK